MYREKPPGVPSVRPMGGGLLDPRVLAARKEIAKVPPKKRDKYKTSQRRDARNGG